MMALDTLVVQGKRYQFYRLDSLGDVSKKMPISHKILAENLMRRIHQKTADESELEALVSRSNSEITFQPMRVLLQDLTGIPVLVDLTSLREELGARGFDASKIEPRCPVDLVIDHSVQVDYTREGALEKNETKEYERNQERYRFLKWAQGTFKGLTVMPPENGIVHQINLEYLAKVVSIKEDTLYFDTLVGTDSHTTMINALGVLGFGVGGIEAEAAMLGQPIPMLIPRVVGVTLEGELPLGVCATDLVLFITERLRAYGVVGKFVEFIGPSLAQLSLQDRATIANMAPEYGATCGLFPIDQRTLDYLKLTERSEHEIERIRAYAEAQGVFGSLDEVVYDECVKIDLAQVKPSIAGPKRPQDRIEISQVKKQIEPLLSNNKGEWKGELIQDAKVVIAAITSCTNTSNPYVLLAAGILAQKARALGLQTPKWVKTSLAPGSRVVTEYLSKAGLLKSLEELGFGVVAYGCTTCIGASGPLFEGLSKLAEEKELSLASVLSGNRNFEGRVHPDVKLNFLASPPYVVAYALAGRMNIDFETEPLGQDKEGQPVFLSSLLPSKEEIESLMIHVQEASSKKLYEKALEGTKLWKSLSVPEGKQFSFSKESTYIKKVPFFEATIPNEKIQNARVLVLLGDSITTDHISPAGAIKRQSSPGEYLLSLGVKPEDFNSLGARRGNHEVMVRGTFANVRLQNQIAQGKSGGYTQNFTKKDAPVEYIFDAAQDYQKEKTPLLVIAGFEYGTGSSRDWAAKGVKLLGVQAVIAKSFERIHRSNLVGMGVLPLQFEEGEDAKSLHIKGDESFSIHLPFGDKKAHVMMKRADGLTQSFELRVRIDTPKEWRYYQSGGLLPYVLNQNLETK